VGALVFAEPELPDNAKVMEEEQKKLQEKIFRLLKGEPVEDDDEDLSIASLQGLISQGGTSSNAEDSTFQQVLQAIASNPLLKSLAGVKPSVSTAVAQPTGVPPVYRAHVPGGLNLYGLPEPFNGRPRALLRAPGPPPLWPGY